MSRLSVGTARTPEALRFPAAVFVLLAVAAGTSWAADPVEPRTWSIELGIGAARVHQSGVLLSGGALGSADDMGGFFKLGFGHTVNDHLVLGLEVGACFIRAGGSGENGIQFFSGLVTGRIYPLKRSPFHFRLAGGTIVRSDHDTYQTPQHLGWEAGIGYDMRLTRSGHLTPFVAYQSAGPGGVATHTLMVGAAWGLW